MSCTVCDPRKGDHPREISSEECNILERAFRGTASILRKEPRGFVYVGGELREIADIHRTQMGTQVQLF